MIEHLHRYGLALELCDGKTVLDIASGEGYGSNLLASKATKVTGVDISRGAIQAAKAKYKKDNLEYIEGIADKIPCDDNYFDVVVSFETIEHHNKHDQMLTEIKRVLKAHGLLIISTPDKAIYTDKKKTRNEFHVKELYKNEFRSLLARYFKNIQLYKQQSFFGSLIVPDEENSRDGDIIFYMGDYSKIFTRAQIEFDYLVALASDNALSNLNKSLFVHEVNKYKEEILRTSTRYQFGNMILNPVQFFKEKFRHKKEE